MAKFAVIINGAAEVGKDTFVNLCREPASRLGFTVCNFSPVDKLKEDIFTADDPYNRSAEHRQRLVDAKLRIAEEDPEYFARGMSHQIRQATRDSVSFLHIREPEQISLTLGFLASRSEDVTTKTLLITRSGLFVPANTADTRVEEYASYDDVIANDAGPDELAVKAEEYIHELIREPASPI